MGTLELTMDTNTYEQAQSPLIGIPLQEQIQDEKQHRLDNGGNDSRTTELILEGLRSSPRYLPSVLLWDEVGLNIYSKIMRSEDYYLTRVETEILQVHVDAIVESIGDGGVIIELGSGCLSKTRVILEGFVRRRMHVQYYALDVCPTTLAESLSDLRSQLNYSNYVTCHPLCMMYNDSIAWLANNASLQTKCISVLWLGASMGNEERVDMHQLLRGLTAALRKNDTSHAGVGKIQFLVAVDGNKDADMVSRAYDTRDDLSRRFVLNILRNLTSVVVFEPAKWAFAGEWDAQEAIYRTSLMALETQAIRFNGSDTTLEITKGEKIQIISSRKLGFEELCEWLCGSGLEIDEAWKHPDIDYSLYRLLPESLTNY
ncbi:histidine-specific methyltransferase [Hypoxylon sp. FL0543]|nr:histidine-specific methyltransferase [Hypoxylon sp. FL0543]